MGAKELTPTIVQVLPDHLIFAPALFKNFVRSKISGSLAAVPLIIVVPFPKEAARIVLIVAPTLTLGNFMIFPFNFLLDRAKIYPFLIV